MPDPSPRHCSNGWGSCMFPAELPCVWAALSSWVTFIYIVSKSQICLKGPQRPEVWTDSSIKALEKSTGLCDVSICCSFGSLRLKFLLIFDAALSHDVDHAVWFQSVKVLCLRSSGCNSWSKWILVMLCVVTGDVHSSLQIHPSQLWSATGYFRRLAGAAKQDHSLFIIMPTGTPNIPGALVTNCPEALQGHLCS